MPQSIVFNCQFLPHTQEQGVNIKDDVASLIFLIIPITRQEFMCVCSWNAHFLAFILTTVLCVLCRGGIFFCLEIIRAYVFRHRVMVIQWLLEWDLLFLLVSKTWNLWAGLPSTRSGTWSGCSGSHPAWAACASAPPPSIFHPNI